MYSICILPKNLRSSLASFMLYLKTYIPLDDSELCTFNWMSVCNMIPFLMLIRICIAFVFILTPLLKNFFCYLNICCSQLNQNSKHQTCSWMNEFEESSAMIHLSQIEKERFSIKWRSKNSHNVYKHFNVNFTLWSVKNRSPYPCSMFIFV